MRDASWSLADRYDAAYYATGLGEPYHRGNPAWRIFFGRVADMIVAGLAPRTALDVGCGIGFLVEELRARGVDARGIDVSEYAISQVPPALRRYCSVGSITDPIERDHDVVVCIEVLEHLPEAVAAEAVARLTERTDDVIFSSSPDDFSEPTHVNVQPEAYWVELFAARGFSPRDELDTSLIAPHAQHFRRDGAPPPPASRLRLARARLRARGLRERVRARRSAR